MTSRPVLPSMIRASSMASFDPRVVQRGSTGKLHVAKQLRHRFETAENFSLAGRFAFLMQARTCKAETKAVTCRRIVRQHHVAGLFPRRH